MPYTDDEIVLEEGGDPEALLMPTEGASRGVWGNLLNAGCINKITKAIKYGQDQLAALSGSDNSIVSRIEALEGQAPGGWTNWRSGQWYRPPICEGMSVELVVMNNTRRYLVPFPYVGRFDGFGYGHSGPQNDYNLYIIDTLPNGMPGDVLWQTTKTSPNGGGTQIATISPTITLKRPCWLGIKSFFGQIYCRGNSDLTVFPPVPKVPSSWALGTSEFQPDVEDIPYVVYGDQAPYTPTTLGNNGSFMGPDIALRSA
jgi:hypothetical protein